MLTAVIISVMKPFSRQCPISIPPENDREFSGGIEMGNWGGKG